MSIERVDRDRGREVQERGTPFHGRLWMETVYPTLGRKVATVWFEEQNDTVLSPLLMSCAWVHARDGHWDLIERRHYDPARSTPGGLAEAHNALCAHLEQVGLLFLSREGT